MHLRALALAGFLVGTSRPAHAADLIQTTTPYPGVVHTIWVDSTLPARIHVLRLNLTSSELVMLSTAEGERGKKPSEYALSRGAQMAINGDFFAAAGFVPAGLAMGEGAAWVNASDSATSGFVRFDRNGARTHMAISPPEEEVELADLDGSGTIGIVGGRPMLVRAGVAASSLDCADLVALPCSPAPRTAVGVSEDGNTGWLVVVDGWQAGSIGMTGVQLATFLDSQLAVYDALMLDIGSASAMYVAGEGGTVSSPSDGNERVVANHLAVLFGALPPGVMRGVVRERDVNGVDIAGATVTLDDGQTTVYNGTAWVFTVAPRYVCATASAPGYVSTTRCEQVAPGTEEYNSLFLFPEADFADGGTRPGADGGPDSGPSAEGEGGGGCGCRATTGGTAGAAWLACALGLLLRSGRRRRETD